MARPANANSDETRRRLVDRAIRLFADHGFHGASARDLTNAAGVNVATLSYYFDGKQGLYDACVDEVYRRLRSRAAEMMARGMPPDLEELFDTLYAEARKERDGVRVLVREVLDHGRLTERTEAAHFLPVIDHAAQLAAQLLHCSVADARAAAVTLGYLVSRFVIQDERSLKVALGVKNAAEAHRRAVDILTTTARALVARKKGKE